MLYIKIILIVIIIFIIVTAIVIEFIYNIDIIIYNNIKLIKVILLIIKAFPDLWKNIKNIINILENKWMEIFFIDN